MLRIDIEQEVVFHPELFDSLAAIGTEAEDCVGSIRMAIDQVFHDLSRTGLLISRECQARQGIGGNLIVLPLNLSPGEFAVFIRIQPDCIIEVAEGDVPLSLNTIALY